MSVQSFRYLRSLFPIFACCLAAGCGETSGTGGTGGDGGGSGGGDGGGGGSEPTWNLTVDSRLIVDDGDSDGDDDPDLNLGIEAAVALDSAGGVHVVYFAAQEEVGTPTRARHGYLPADQPVFSQFSINAGLGDEQGGGMIDIAIDADDTLHVIYKGDHPSKLYHASASLGGSWVWAINAIAEPAGGRYIADYRMEVTTDADGGIHIMYRNNDDQSDGPLYTYLSAAGAAPADRLLLPAGTGYMVNRGREPGMAIHDGTLYFSMASDAELHFGTCDTLGDVVDNAAWSIESLDTVDEMNNSKTFTDIAVDSEGGVHIVYTDLGLYATRYAYRGPSDSGFTLSTVDDGVRGEYSAIAIDSDDGVHIVYHNYNDEDVYAAFKPAGTDTWNIAAVEADRDWDNDSDTQTDLVIDSDDNLHIVYTDQPVYQERRVKYVEAHWVYE